MRKITFFTILLGAVMLVCGIVSGEQNDVFIKGIRICLECIGIG